MGSTTISLINHFINLPKGGLIIGNVVIKFSCSWPTQCALRNLVRQVGNLWLAAEANKTKDIRSKGKRGGDLTGI